jgi:hypothetical protein
MLDADGTMALGMDAALAALALFAYGCQIVSTERGASEQFPVENS